MGKMISSMVQTIERAARYAMGSGREYMALYWGGILDELKRIQKGEPYILASYYIPRSILALFDIPVLYMERTAGLGCICDVASLCNTGCASVCSYQRYLHGMFSSGDMPLPYLVTAADVSCGDALDYCRHLAEVNGIPIIEITLKGNSQNVALQLESLYLQLKQYFPVRKTVKDITSDLNEAMMWKQKVDMLHEEKKFVLSAQDYINLFPIYNDLGLSVATSCLHALYDSYMKVKNKVSIECSHNLIWLGTAPVRASLLQRIEKEFDCRFIYVELFDFPAFQISEENYFHGLAEQIHSTRFCFLSSRIRNLLKVIDAFSVCGIIHFSQRRCQLLPAMVPTIRDEMKDYGIPVLELCGDGMEENPCIDDYLRRVSKFINEL